MVDRQSQPDGRASFPWPGRIRIPALRRSCGGRLTRYPAPYSPSCSLCLYSCTGRFCWWSRPRIWGAPDCTCLDSVKKWNDTEFVDGTIAGLDLEPKCNARDAKSLDLNICKESGASQLAPCHRSTRKSTVTYISACMGYTKNLDRVHRMYWVYSLVMDYLLTENVLFIWVFALYKSDLVWNNADSSPYIILKSMPRTKNYISISNTAHSPTGSKASATLGINHDPHRYKPILI